MSTGTIAGTATSNSLSGQSNIASAPITANNAPVSVTGLSSGLDTASIIQKLVSIKQMPINTLTTEQQTAQQKLTVLNNLNTQLQNFQGVVSIMNTTNQFIATTGNFTSSTVLPSGVNPVTVTTNSLAASGTYSLSISQLAQATQIISDGFASTASAIPTGLLRIAVGNQSTTLKIDSTNNNLGSLQTLINNAGLGVQASFVNTGDPNSPIRLLITGTNTGAANAVSVQMNQQNLGAGPTPLMNFTQTQAAQNANFTLNGVPITNSSNTISTVLQGVTLKLNSTGSGTLAVNPDNNAITTTINNFVNSYNNVMTFLNQQTKVNQTSGAGGPLTGDYMAVNLQQQLQSIISSPVSGTTGAYNYLSQIGITSQTDGTLTVDTAQLNTALASNLPSVAQLFATQGTTTNSAVSYVGISSNTIGGTYDIRISGGVPQLSPTGANQFTNTTGAGNFFTGAAGTPAAGLNFGITGSHADGSYGTITVSTGIADSINNSLSLLTDFSQNGPLASDVTGTQQSVTDLGNTITDQQNQLTLYQQNLQSQFTNMETAIGNLKSQQGALSSALSALNIGQISSATTTSAARSATSTAASSAASSATASSTGH